MDHRINMRQPLPLTPLFPGLNLTYALKLLHAPYEFWRRHLLQIRTQKRAYDLLTIFATKIFPVVTFACFPLAFHAQPRGCTLPVQDDQY